jgi:micrococcal nuclease
MGDRKGVPRVLVVMIVGALLGAGAGDDAGAQENSGVPRAVAPRGTLSAMPGVDRPSGQRFIRIAGSGLPEFPTIDVVCDGKLRTFPLTRSERTTEGIAGVYAADEAAVEAMLRAAECRLFVPGHEVRISRQQFWTEWAAPHGRAEAPRVVVGRVVDVIDATTVKVDLGGRTEIVAYIGVRTPDVAHPERRAEGAQREAVEVNRALVAGRQARLELDVQERDRDGRLLAYVYVGDRMINAELVRRGYARLREADLNVRHQALLARLEREARDGKRGLWARPSSAAAAPPAAGERGRPGVEPSTAWTCPPSHPIKGNFTPYSGERCIYHVPGGRFYDRTKPERCYAAEDDARADGCRRSRR